MGASSIYRHVETKEELLVQELAELQEDAWTRFRSETPGDAPARERIRRFFRAQHDILAQEPDLTVIALRATTYPNARVARRVLALHDRSIGLVAEILLAGRTRGELERGTDVLASARTLFHVASGARLSWANGVLDEQGCRAAIDAAVDVVFSGIGAPAPRSS
jgi:AcrR family transcriptional regulator